MSDKEEWHRNNASSSSDDEGTTSDDKDQNVRHQVHKKKMIQSNSLQFNMTNQKKDRSYSVRVGSKEGKTKHSHKHHHDDDKNKIDLEEIEKIDHKICQINSLSKSGSKKHKEKNDAAQKSSDSEYSDDINDIISDHDDDSMIIDQINSSNSSSEELDGNSKKTKNDADSILANKKANKTDRRQTPKYKDKKQDKKNKNNFDDDDNFIPLPPPMIKPTDFGEGLMSPPFESALLKPLDTSLDLPCLNSGFLNLNQNSVDQNGNKNSNLMMYDMGVSIFHTPSFLDNDKNDSNNSTDLVNDDDISQFNSLILTDSLISENKQLQYESLENEKNKENNQNNQNNNDDNNKTNESNSNTSETNEKNEAKKARMHKERSCTYSNKRDYPNKSALYPNREQFAPADIRVSQYFKEIVTRYLNIPLSSSPEKILQQVEPYTIIGYFKQYVRKHHYYGSISMKYQSLDEISSYSEKPLYKPLLKSIPKNDKDKKDRCVLISYLLLKNIGVFSFNESNNNNNNNNGNNIIDLDDPKDMPMKLALILSDDTDLYDEAYLQLIKQIRKCPDKRKRMETWKLLVSISATFLPSDTLRPYVFAFIIRSIYGKDKGVCFISRFIFIKLIDRTLMSNFEKHIIKDKVNKMAMTVFFGLTMFSCSLYEIIWCQKRQYPRLPIPLPMYLILKNIMKNGGLITPNLLTKYGDKRVVNRWTRELPKNNNAIDNGEVSNLIGLLFYWLENLINPIISFDISDIFIEKCRDASNDISHYNELIEKMPHLHLNTLRYLIGFLREINKFEQYNFMSIEKIAEALGPFLVDTTKKLYDPFKSAAMKELSVGFVVYCLEKLDVTPVYPLNPEYLKTAEAIAAESKKAKDQIQEKTNDEEGDEDNVSS